MQRVVVLTGQERTLLMFIAGSSALYVYRLTAITMQPVTVRRRKVLRGAGAWSSSSWMRFGTGGPGGGGEMGGGGGEGGIVAAAVAASVLNVSRVLLATPLIVPSSTMGSTSFTSTEIPSAFRAFVAAVSVESSTSASGRAEKSYGAP